MAELLYSIKKIFTSYSADKKFLIPEYQRGYKWSSQQVRQLLDDVLKFSKSRDEAHFYCLQNVTLFSEDKKSPVLNVVDGQQRLTTVTILLSYLGEAFIAKEKFKYAVRETSDLFLQKIIFNEDNIIDEIVTALNFDSFLASKNEDLDYQDIYHMFTALRTIDSWFVENGLKDSESFKDVILEHVKLIVNHVQNVSEQELFMNLNAGKVHLDGSDLIRAILITRVVKQEIEEFDSNNVQEVVQLNQRRTRIGWEIDELATWWSNTEVSEYFKNFTSIVTGKKETIKFDQDQYHINLLYKIWCEINGKDDIKLYWFEEREAIEIYQSILKLNRILQDWYKDRELYHYLGYLFAFKMVTIRSVYDEWMKAESRRHFIDYWCINNLKKTVFSPEKEETISTSCKVGLGRILDYRNPEPTNWYTAENIQELLVLLDVMEHAKVKKEGVPLPFLKPKFFKNYKEDKEHIFSGTPREISELKKLDQPIYKLNEYIDKLNEGYDESDHLSYVDLSEDEWGNLDEEGKAVLLQEFKERIHKNRPVNSIGNLVLLHQTINRGFGNNSYSLKRDTVIKNSVEGLYVRQHTINVFVKNTYSKDLNDWTLKDIEINAQQIHDMLLSFFN